MPLFTRELNCSAQEGPISADADVVGPGVLAAFLVSSALTIIAVFFGYLSGSLGDEHMTPLDRAIIKWARLNVPYWMGKIFRSKRIRQTEVQPRSKAWKHAVSRFILSLSDQQLVTGLAILISGFANWKTLTSWEFQVVLSLAWFSTTSHLATLDALRTYHKSKPIIRHIRVIGMTAVLGLLLGMFALVLFALGSFAFQSDSEFDNSNLLQCFLDSQDPPSKLEGSALSDALNMWAIPLLVVIFGYYGRISELYWGYWLPPLASNFLFEGDIPSLFKRRLGGQDSDPTSVEDMLEFRQASARSWMLRMMARHKHQLSTDPSLRELGTRRVEKMGDWHLRAGFFLATGSFLSSLYTITFSLSYGLAQLVYFRWTKQPPLEDDAGSWGFGQIMALFLLVLPPLAAIESYYDYAESQMSPLYPPGTGSPWGPPSNPDLVSTAPPLPLAEPMDITDHESVHAAYNHNSEDIRRYLAFDVALLANLEENRNVSPADQNSLVEKKHMMLIRYQELREVERTIPIFGATILVLVYILSGVVIGVLLGHRHRVKAPDWYEPSHGMIVVMDVAYIFSCILFFVAWPVFKLIKLRAVKIYSIFEEEENTQQPAPEGSSGDTPGEPGPTVELTELNASRRTATGLVEEGRSPQGDWS